MLRQMQRYRIPRASTCLYERYDKNIKLSAGVLLLFVPELKSVLPLAAEYNTTILSGSFCNLMETEQ